MLLDSKSIGSRGFFIGWALLLFIAFALDGPVAHALAPVRTYVKQSTVAEEIREGGNFAATLMIVVFLGVLHRDRWRAATLVLLSAAMTGILRLAIAVVLGRTRPFVHVAPLDWHPFHFDFPALLHGRNVSFPSGHTSVAFGTAVALACVLPRGRWLFMLLAILVGAERVAETAHYLSDVMAAALLAVLTFPLAERAHQYAWGRFAATSGSATVLATS